MKEMSPVGKVDARWMQGGLIPVGQWRGPETSVKRSLKDASRHILAQITAGAVGQKELSKSVDDLPELSASKLKSIAPYPDSLELAAELSNVLEEKCSSDAGTYDVTFLVSPPFSGIRSALDRFSAVETCSGDEIHHWVLIVPPENLLMDDQAAREWWDRQDLSRPWVISELADFWLRHLSGLALIRELFRRVAAGIAGRGIIGCSSWCWQFWSCYFEDACFMPMTAAPMGAAELGGWFESLASDNGREPLSVRMAGDGLWVLPIAAPKKGKKLKRSGFLRELASAARGNPGVALAIWRRAFRARPEEEADTDAAEEGAGKGATGSRGWIVPFDQLGLPTVPQTEGSRIGLVLHALLLHAGLSTADMELVTGMPGAELSFVLARLSREELLEREEPGCCWQVTAHGYPSIRRHLESWGFPVDAF